MSRQLCGFGLDTIERYHTGVDVLAIGWPGQRRVGCRITRLLQGQHQMPLHRPALHSRNQSIVQIVLTRRSRLIGCLGLGADTSTAVIDHTPALSHPPG